LQKLKTGGVMNYYFKTISISLFVLLCMLIIAQVEKTQAQTFYLGEREYRVIDGTWYNFSGRQKGD